MAPSSQTLSVEDRRAVAAWAADCAEQVLAISAGAAARHQVALMTDDVARAISSLPALGDDRSGPLGPGRLTWNHVGETIRAI